MSTLRITILGCGSSVGVPRADGEWGACDPGEPRNVRSRCGLLVQQWAGDAAGAERDCTSVLIDTSPDLRGQLIKAGVAHVDGVLYSHDHADQTHGIDDLRALVMRTRRRIKIWMDAPTRKTLLRRFGYCFLGEGSYPAILEDSGELHHGQDVTIEGPGGVLRFTPLDQDHGHGTLSLGFRFGPAAYSNDVVLLPERSLERLGGLDLWIVDALRYQQHPTHANLAQALAWIERLKPKRAMLTNMHIDLDYGRVAAETPAHVDPAFDGWSIDLPA